MTDFHACRWPPRLTELRDTTLAEHMDNLNEPALSNVEVGLAIAVHIITLSYHLTALHHPGSPGF